MHGNVFTQSTWENGGWIVTGRWVCEKCKRTAIDSVAVIVRVRV